MEILTTAQMYSADKETVAKIMPEEQLIENAGFAAACQITKNYAKRPVLVLCGNGNNGADGFVVARILHEWGWPVEVAFAGDLQKMPPAAKKKADRFKGGITLPSFKRLEQLEAMGGLVIDAVFGIGLTRAIDGDIAEFISALNETELPCVALDIPSGINANTGEIMGIAPFCEMTITFCRPKIGHLLYPGKEYTGHLIVCPIGIPDEIVEQQNPFFYENTPDLFSIPAATPYDHKYSRGAVLIYGGKMTGAARLAAAACRRSGAGFTALSCLSADYPVYAAGSPGLVVQKADTADEFEKQINDPKISAAVIGMGSGIKESTKKRLHLISESKKPFVADADALTYIKGIKDLSRAVITPHAGEFSRLFPELDGQNKLAKALNAAQTLNCIVVLKGADTVIASPEGVAAIDNTSNFNLATAGSGDVLAGMIGAMLSKGLDPFEAACAGVWLHSKAAEVAGDDLIAEDIIDALR